MSAEQCAARGGTATEQTRTLRISRGDRSVEVATRYWLCTCPPAEEGGEAETVEWVDGDQARAAEIAAAAAWVETYGEPMPAAKRLGQKAEVQEPVVVSLSAADLARLDAARGELSRAELVQQAIQEKLARLSV